MKNEIDFIKDELKKRGYPLENYVQSMLVERKWRVQPNAYFQDKNTGKGRELDIKAYYDKFEIENWHSLLKLNLLIQCKKILGNAWIFFSIPQQESVYANVQTSNLARFLELPPALSAFTKEGTHFDKSDILATNYCEIITDEDESNKKTKNIWQCVITLIKATCEEVETDAIDTEQHLNEIGYENFIKSPFEVINIFYPLIVFEGKMYHCQFLDDEIIIQSRDYIPLLVDYKSRRYEGTFIIDVITKNRFSKYLRDITEDLTVFNKQRINIAREYESTVLKELDTYFKCGNISFLPR